MLEFENGEDRDFYVKYDEAHKAFGAFVEPLLECPGGVQVLDYVPGMY